MAVHLVTKEKNTAYIFWLGLSSGSPGNYETFSSPNDKHKTSDYCRSTNDFIVTIVY